MLRLRQVAFVARDLASAEAELATPLGLQLGYRDPEIIGFGLANALFPVGDQLLEIVSPVQDGTTAGRLLERRGGDAGYMVIFQVDDLEGVPERLEAAGIRVVYDAKGDGIRGLHLHPRDVGGAIVSLDASEVPEDWNWAGPTWRDAIDTSVVDAVVGVEISVANPAETAARWGAALGVAPAIDGEDATIEIDDAVIRFVADPDDGGVTGLDVRASDRSRAGETRRLVGVEVRLV